ncbi:rRNA-processing protein Fcf2 [Ceratobasidium sp. AG-Ba]|nr:rRNA-processing protein Fcf2 [Ceratobasidium sp. AG-Ba]QRW14990.1 rRNA-processing protein Fcf2 [Ceratobasidium sp. AG-Ba]
MSRAPSPTPSTSSDSSLSEEAQTTLMKELLQKAERACRVNTATDDVQDDELLTLAGEDELPPLPKLNPGLSGQPTYFCNEAVLDPKAFQLSDEVASPSKGSMSLHKGKGKGKAEPLSDQDEVMKGMTKRERKEMKLQTAGPQWFDLPAPRDSDRPRLARELEALRLRNALDPKRFYRKDAEGGKREMPKYFAIGKVVDAATPFRDADHNQNLTRAERKRTIVEELVEDAEAKRYAKKKFGDLQAVRSERGRGTLTRKFAKRKPKW